MFFAILLQNDITVFDFVQYVDLVQVNCRLEEIILKMSALVPRLRT